jgi:hypothetical protein
MYKEFIGLLMVFIIFWYFNIRKQEYVTIDLPVEKMKNVFIFEG